MRTRAMEEEGGGGEKRRKIVGDGELTLLQITTCSTIGSTKEELQFTDLEEIVEIGAVAKCNFDIRTRKPRSDRFKAGSGENETVTAKPSTVINRTVPAEKMPSATELEEFFASAETELHKRFKEKYNYDIVNDTPLEGRFQWIQVNP
ncbi:hypothetical protein OSB04_000501 [Centaurea solstitialis]|uniref:Cyclin-dependent kinase inhibitor domain-containing protein n=1 Tax=Centaurea solstitialis TaxID=347529 RepID=A0AA38U0X8_9ASTR|nr:hypothetical protein OSB04_000501 [Centaurea solstitialis]